jgi:hypothetical protein
MSVFECRERHVMFLCLWERLEGSEDVLCLGVCGNALRGVLCLCVCGNALKRDVQFVHGNALKWHVKLVFVSLFVCVFWWMGKACYVCVWERL